MKRLVFIVVNLLPFFHPPVALGVEPIPTVSRPHGVDPRFLVRLWLLPTNKDVEEDILALKKKERKQVRTFSYFLIRESHLLPSFYRTSGTSDFRATLREPGECTIHASKGEVWTPCLKKKPSTDHASRSPLHPHSEGAQRTVAWSLHPPPRLRAARIHAFFWRDLRAIAIA